MLGSRLPWQLDLFSIQTKTFVCEITGRVRVWKQADSCSDDLRLAVQKGQCFLLVVFNGNRGRKRVMGMGRWAITNLWRSKGLSNVRTFSLPSLWWLGLGATTCVEGMLPACSCVCDRSDKRRKDTKKGEFDNEKTNGRAISTVKGCLVADKLSFLSLDVRSFQIVHVTADATKRLFTCNRP